VTPNLSEDGAEARLNGVTLVSKGGAPKTLSGDLLPHIEETEEATTWKLSCGALVLTSSEAESSISSVLKYSPFAFDGTRFVVEPNFGTKVKHVMIGGAGATFSRKYGLTRPFSELSDVEVGKEMARVLLEG